MPKWNCVSKETVTTTEMQARLSICDQYYQRWNESVPAAKTVCKRTAGHIRQICVRPRVMWSAPTAEKEECVERRHVPLYHDQKSKR